LFTKNAWRIPIPAIAPESTGKLRPIELKRIDILAYQTNISPRKIQIDPQIQI
jgi:hypothetical protein